MNNAAVFVRRCYSCRCERRYHHNRSSVVPRKKSNNNNNGIFIRNFDDKRAMRIKSAGDGIDGVSGEASYVWQCGSPLRVSLNRRGSLAFGVNMDDEWYVVYLLRRVSEAFDVAVQVWDEDGEFLLIEAAYSLPGWLEPAVAANRVWVYRGAVHCLPREKNGGIDVSSAEGALKSLVVHAAAAKACGAAAGAV